MKKIVDAIQRFAQDRQGAVGAMTAVTVLTLVTATGIAIDVSRTVEFRTALQSAVDSAALAGATVYTSTTANGLATSTATTYMNQIVANLPSNKGVTFTTAAATQPTGGNTVTVTANAPVGTTITSIFTGSIPVTASATAINPIVQATFDFGGWYADAADTNSIYWYYVPKDGSIPTPSQIPAANQLFTNAKGATNKSSQTITVSSTQPIGFAFKNVVGGNQPYGANGYGAAQGTTHWFFSQDKTLSKTAYKNSPNGNCSLQVQAVNAKTYSDNAPNQGSCTAQAPATAAVSCDQLSGYLQSGQVMRYFWNDMGGTSDDDDYNDGEYNFFCNPISNLPPSVVLLK